MVGFVITYGGAYKWCVSGGGGAWWWSSAFSVNLLSYWLVWPRVLVLCAGSPPPPCRGEGCVPMRELGVERDVAAHVDHGMRGSEVKVRHDEPHRAHHADGDGHPRRLAMQARLASFFIVCVRIIVVFVRGVHWGADEMLVVRGVYQQGCLLIRRLRRRLHRGRGRCRRRRLGTLGHVLVCRAVPLALSLRSPCAPRSNPHTEKKKRERCEGCFVVRGTTARRKSVSKKGKKSGKKGSAAVGWRSSHRLTGIISYRLTAVLSLSLSLSSVFSRFRFRFRFLQSLWFLWDPV